MAPAKQGMYEFNSDTLVEIRKSLGISQSKMAELLDVPANTLSRWETGATVPDGESLASIYSLAKERGMSPTFFNVRRIPLEIKMGSYSSELGEDSLTLIKSLHQFLKTEIEILGQQDTPTIKIVVTNTASAEPVFPKVVFTDVGLSMAHNGGDYNILHSLSIHRALKTKRIDNPPVTVTPQLETPWLNDEERRGLLRTNFTRIDNNAFYGDSGKPEILFPGQAVIYEFNAKSEILPYLEFKVDGLVSRRHLFHTEEAFTMPEQIIKPVLIRGLTEYNKIDLYTPLNDLIKALPNFNNETKLTEIHTFVQAIPTFGAKLKAIQNEIVKLCQNHKFSPFRAHLRANMVFTMVAINQLDALKKAIESNVPDNLVAAISSTLAFRQLAAKLDSETRDLMKAFNIAADEVGYLPPAIAVSN